MRRNPKRKTLKLKLVLALLLLPAVWFGYRAAKVNWGQPQALLVLGGAIEREAFAAEFARQYPHLPIWISGGSNPEYTQAVFAEAGIDLRRVHIDRAAVDTVTNFTTVIDQLQAQGIDSVYLVTSDYHMRRARVIGEIVFGSRGIVLKPLSVPSQQAGEPIVKSIRDAARSVLWLTTGYTGSTLHHSFNQ
jgi:uncharacterized SAM-binding protein YcdF (DUF218 family)